MLRSASGVLGTVEVGNGFPRDGTDGEWKIAGRDAILTMKDGITKLATAAAGAVILATGFGRADGIAALAVAAITLRAAVQLLRAARVSVEEVGLAMARYPNVAEVHDLHVWEIGSGFPALSAHILVAADADCHAIRRELEALVAERFAIDHTTLQVDHARADLLQIGTEPVSH